MATKANAGASRPPMIAKRGTKKKSKCACGKKAKCNCGKY